MITGASGFIGCGAAVAGSLWRARQARNITDYGSARWAEKKDIPRAGLFDDADIFLGRSDDARLRHDGPEHMMAFAPTRSGKGVGLWRLCCSAGPARPSSMTSRLIAK